VNQRTFDLVVGTIFLFNIAFFGVKMAARRRVMQGQTTGISGILAHAVAVGA
jgi:poly(A) polymerase Pap1